MIGRGPGALRPITSDGSVAIWLVSQACCVCELLSAVSMAANWALRRFCSVAIRALSLSIWSVKSFSVVSSLVIRPVRTPLVPVCVPT